MSTITQTPPKITIKQIAGHQLSFVSDVYEGKLYDTRVFLDSTIELCTIEGGNIEKFCQDFDLMINHYKI